MRKYALLLVLTAFVVAAVSGCGLIVKDSAVDAQTVIIEVAGKTIVKAEVQQVIQNVLDYQEYVYILNGYSYDRTDADTLASAQETAINALIEEAVTEQKIRDYALDQFTEEDLAAISATVDETYAGYYDTVKSYYFADTELAGDELNAAIEAKILEIGYSSKEDLLVQQRKTESTNKLRDMVVKDVTVTVSEIEAQYAQGVSDAQDSYATTLTQYASDLNGGAIIYYKPAGYRYVKNLLIKIGDEEKTEIASLTTQISDDQDSLESTQAAIDDMNTQIAENTKDTTAETIDSQQKSMEELTAQAGTLTAEIESLTAQLNELSDAAYGTVQPKVDEVLAKITAGEDFDALIAEYGEDTGMTVEPAKTKGYLVCDGLTTYLTEFVNEAMALQNVGDISEPFRTSNGVHIVKYDSDMESGTVPLTHVRGQISEELLAGKQDTVYNETLSQWVKEANAKTYADRLAD